MLLTNNDWTPLADSGERTIVKRLARENGKRGGHTGKVYASTAAMLEATEMRGLSEFRRAAFEAHYCFKQAVHNALDTYQWDCRTDITQDDIEFSLSLSFR